MRKRDNQKNMLIFRYSYIILAFISVVSKNNYDNLSFIVLFLIYLINNQIRYFLVDRSKRGILVSVILECIISLYFFKTIENFAVLMMIPTIIDITYNFKNTFKNIYIAAVVARILYQNDLQQILIGLSIILPVFLLTKEIKEEEDKKLYAQILYDKLKEKDDELKSKNKELESYANTIEEITVLRERNRISREIHDSVGHALSTIIIQLGAIEKIAITNSKEASKMAKVLSGFAKESMEGVRSAVREMKPREFEKYEGIIAISEMIKNFIKLTGVNVRLQVSENLWKLNSDQTMVIYRIVQEFLSNSIRHGKATEVNIFMNFLEDKLRIHLKNNGLSCTYIKPGVGLKSIKERVAVWGGRLEYFSGIDDGFEVVVTMDRVKLALDGAL